MYEGENFKAVSSVDDFRCKLRLENKPYLIGGERAADKVNIQFEGKLDGQPVVWNACIRTIEEYSKKYSMIDDPQQFIDIQVSNGVFFLEVALNLRQINQAVIESTIIMIKKYKRLQLGRHEYGARSKTE